MDERIFLVEDDSAGGYTAQALGFGICTEADTKKELTANVREAVEVCFDKPKDLPKVIRLHFVHDRASKSESP